MTYTVTLSDYNAGTYVFTNTTCKITNVTYAIAENITLTN